MAHIKMNYKEFRKRHIDEILRSNGLLEHIWMFSINRYEIDFHNNLELRYEATGRHLLIGWSEITLKEYLLVEVIQIES